MGFLHRGTYGNTQRRSPTLCKHTVAQRRALGLLKQLRVRGLSTSPQFGAVLQQQQQKGKQAGAKVCRPLAGQLNIKLAPRDRGKLRGGGKTRAQASIGPKDQGLQSRILLTRSWLGCFQSKFSTGGWTASHAIYQGFQASFIHHLYC